MQLPVSGETYRNDSGMALIVMQLQPLCGETYRNNINRDATATEWGSLQELYQSLCNCHCVGKLTEITSIVMQLPLCGETYKNNINRDATATEWGNLQE